MSKFSDVKVGKVLHWLSDLAIIKVSIDGKVIWDDGAEPYIDYEEVIKDPKYNILCVDKFEVNIVYVHHIEVNITTLKETE